jgi:hypothetical protein
LSLRSKAIETNLQPLPIPMETKSLPWQQSISQWWKSQPHRCLSVVKQHCTRCKRNKSFIPSIQDEKRFWRCSKKNATSCALIIHRGYCCHT